jgi:hypothetical protein
MKKYKWTNDNGITFTAGEKPAGGEWHPVWAASRVRGDSYTPYDGHTEWDQMANREMAETARSNFEHKNTH